MLFTIQFNFALDKGPLKVLLAADVEQDDQGILYFVKNFRVTGHRHTGIMPEIKIKRIDGRWVHRDSGWQTELSKAAGEAIDRAVAAFAGDADGSDSAERRVD
jgi:hypothetical protein